MNKLVWAIVVTLFIGALGIDAQVKKNPPSRKQLSTVPVKTSPAPAEYEINALVVKGLGVFVVSVSPLPDVAISNEKAFQSFFNDLYGGSEFSPREQRALPKVVIKFGDDDDIQTLVNAIKFVYVSSKMAVELENLIDPTRMFVVPEPNENEQINVKPNPLNLFVQMNNERNLSLNDEEMGSISDLSKLSYRGREI